MKRYPNPWVAIPVLLGAFVGGGLGWSITSLTCSPDACPAVATTVALITALATAIGVGVVVVLAIRSVEEWREAARRGLDPPGPGCEVPDHGPESTD